MNLILAILRTVPLFQSLTEEQHEAIMEHITMEYYPTHYKLFEKGLVGDAMYIIKSGQIRIHNEEQDLATLGEGQFFGEMSLIEDQPRMASAETLSDCEIFVLKREDFSELMGKSPDIAQSVRAAYEARKAENANN
ncbi:MAG: CRP/FNR family cyclic AMP-dependent transcriptional regulator [Oceanicoccus sp.]|jgi:CRP/FNR family cyclic AMP-dependent transcriptional regulator